jgi:hypothetical protein
MANSVTDAKRSRILNNMTNVTHKADKAREIICAIPRDALHAYVDMDFNAHTLKTRTALAFRVGSRETAVHLMGLMPPLPLVNVEVEIRRAREKQFWPAWYESKHVTVLNKQALCPFIFQVDQGQYYGPLVTLTWLAQLGEHKVAIQVQIVDDPARFVIETKGKVGTRQEARWARNDHFPIGYTAGRWNDWRPYYQNEGLASCSVFWYLDKIDRHLVEQGTMALARALLLEGKTNGET